MSKLDGWTDYIQKYVDDPNKLISDLETAKNAAQTGVDYAKQAADLTRKYGQSVVDILNDPEFPKFLETLKLIVATRKRIKAGLGAPSETTAASEPTTMGKMNSYAKVYLWYLNHRVLSWFIVGGFTAGLVGGGIAIGRYLLPKRS